MTCGYNNGLIFSTFYYFFSITYYVRFFCIQVNFVFRDKNILTYLGIQIRNKKLSIVTFPRLIQDFLTERIMTNHKTTL